MLIACFNLLKDYVEKEHAFKVIDWEADDSHRQTALEIKRLYRWWTHDRLLAQQAVEHRYLDDATKYITKDEALERVDNRMLRRLIEIREYLWT
jgi:predicted nucleic acid-binding protein